MTRTKTDRSDLNRVVFHSMDLRKYLEGLDPKEVRKLDKRGLLPEYLFIMVKDFRAHYKEAYRQTFNKPCPSLKIEEDEPR